MVVCQQSATMTRRSTEKRWTPYQHSVGKCALLPCLVFTRKQELLHIFCFFHPGLENHVLPHKGFVLTWSVVFALRGKIRARFFNQWGEALILFALEESLKLSIGHGFTVSHLLPKIFSLVHHIAAGLVGVSSTSTPLKQQVEPPVTAFFFFRAALFSRHFRCS